MTIGEIEYTRFFTDQQLFSPTFSRVVFLAFCVMMPIVLMNLTVRTFSYFLSLSVNVQQTAGNTSAFAGECAFFLNC